MPKEYIYNRFLQIEKELRPRYKCRRSAGYFEKPLHYASLKALINNSRKKRIIFVVKGVGNRKFMNKTECIGAECHFLADVIRNNINDKEITDTAFTAMKKILKSATKILKNNKDASEVEETQSLLESLAGLREDFPDLTKQTDDVYSTYKKMMFVYSKSGLHSFSNKTFSKSDDYFYGCDDYKISGNKVQIDSSWKTHDQLSLAKQRVHEKITQKEIKDYEEQHARQVKQEDLQDKMEREKILSEHEDYILNKEHLKQITEDSLRNNEQRLEKAYENFKGIARKATSKDATKTMPSKKVPKRAVFIARADYQNSKERK